ncbi:Origin recognition complex subunit 2 [Marasmius tenuissimus]|nr:Origin recognition complex subunit 2 [Marasmius tenuissimus]
MSNNVHALSSMANAASNAKDEQSGATHPPVDIDVESVHEVEGQDLTTAYPPSVQRHPLPSSKTYHALSPHILGLLIPFTIFGTLARLGLQALTTYDGQSIFPLAYIQSTGCFVMGFFLRLKGPMGEFYTPLYTAITTGFCGSLTTFSGWQFDIFDSWINYSGADRGGLRHFIDGLTKTVFTLSISLASLSFGSYLCKHTAEPYVSKLGRYSPPRTVRVTLTMLSVLTYFATIPVYFLLSPSFRRQATAALLFAYPGTLTRYLLSVYLNPIIESFPLGTFSANIIGTGLLAIFHVLQDLGAGSRNPVSPNTCSLLQGLGDGYCACLTTISTFAAEIRTLKAPWEKIRYVVLSWVVGQALILMVTGPAMLSGAVGKDRVCTFE